MRGERPITIYYIGQNPFTSGILKNLFTKKELEMERLSSGVQIQEHCLLLIDSPEEIKQSLGFQVYISAEPTYNIDFDWWAKDPIEEKDIDNLLFYYNNPQYKFRDKTTEPKKIPALERFAGNNLDNLKKVLCEYINNLSSNFRVLALHAHNGNLQEMGNTAHKMLSSSGYYESKKLTDILRELENPELLLKDHLPTKIDELYSAILELRSGLIAEYF